jgi:hypothetical protein
MGIDLQTKPPVERPPVEPVTLIYYQAYANGGGEAPPGAIPEGSPRWEYPKAVSARLLNGQEAVQPGTRVAVMSLEPGSTTLWVPGNGARCVAEVLGAEAAQLSTACRTAQAGFVGTVTSVEHRQDGDELQVRIDGI